MRGWVTRLVVLLAVTVVQPARADQVSATATLDSTEYLVGDPIRVRATIQHPAGTKVTSAIGDTIGPFHVLSPSAFVSSGDTTTTADLVVSMYDSGSVSIPPITFLCALPGDTTFLQATTHPLPLRVHLADVDTTQPIKELRPPIEIPLALSDVLLFVGLFVLIVIAGYLLYRYWKKRKESEVHTEKIIPSRPAHVLALEELTAVREKRLWQQGFIKEYYSEVTEVLRRYFESRYHVPALEQTTDEILVNIRPHVSEDNLIEVAENLFSMADLAKFAKFRPSVTEHEETMTMAVRIVEETAATETAKALAGQEVAEDVRA